MLFCFIINPSNILMSEHEYQKYKLTRKFQQKYKQAGIELGFNQAETVSLELTNQVQNKSWSFLFYFYSIKILFEIDLIAINQIKINQLIQTMPSKTLSYLNLSIWYTSFYFYSINMSLYCVNTNYNCCQAQSSPSLARLS